MWAILLLLIIGGSVNGNTVYYPRNAKTGISFIPGDYSKNISIFVEIGKESVIDFPPSNSENPYTVYAWTEKQQNKYPILLTTRQKRIVTSWEVPLTVHSKIGAYKFYNTSRTLCHTNMDVISRTPRKFVAYKLHKTLSLSVSTTSLNLLSLTIRIEEQDNFYLKENEVYETRVSPSEPRYFYYQFLEKTDLEYKTVILEVFSDDDVCLTVSIQNASCPVFDLDKDVSFKGQYQTISTKGAVIIKRDTFPKGFFVVFVSKGDNYECSYENSIIRILDNSVQLLGTETRSTKIRFSLKPTINKGHVNPVGATIIFYLIILLFSWVLFQCRNKIQVVHVPRNNQPAAVAPPSLRQEAVRIFQRDQLVVENNGGLRSNEEVRNRNFLRLDDFAKKGRRYYVKKSFEYFWHVISVAIFYGMPVVQLVVTYQKILSESGNRDICYYNFLCAHPFGMLSDFNHIFSNIGYVLTGLAFFIITTSKAKHLKHTLPNYGIPKQFGLFYAMSLSLIMEGILSACYHICPNQSNFQFDTSFMYIMVALCAIKLYQNRHPDINVTAYITFIIIGFAVFATMVGVITGHIIFWIVFILGYVSFCFYISLKVYFLRETALGLKNVARIALEEDIITAITPTKKARFYFLVLGNVLNTILMWSLMYVFYHNFATYLLTLFIINMILYIIVYIISKKRNGERICIQAKVFLLLSLITWTAAAWCFLNKSTDWRVTAAGSRQFNTKCVLLNYYDYHDIWHLLSAVALFFTFMLLLCVDDDLINRPHSRIAVF